MNVDEIRPVHRQRLAYVYIRQSTAQQVVHNRESQLRQRRLAERAIELGWPRENLVVVDEDLGESGSRSGRRDGFDEMVAQAAIGKIGVIFALEVSRISRGNRNWYHLLDICAITQTLIADAEGIYDPRAYNDRLLLGLKGTMSEAELHMIKQRLVEAVRSRARRGEYRFPLPPGYIWDEADRMVKHPDDQVRSTLALVFSKFDALGAIHAVQVALREEGVRVPMRTARGQGLRWSVPGYCYLHRVLTNPLYAGAYVFGLRQVEESLDEAQQPIKRVRSRSRGSWPVLIPDHHEGYINWEKFERNQRQIVANRRGGAPGAPHSGGSLLQGLVLCGRCGRRMHVAYNSRNRRVWYRCISQREQTGAAVCQSFGAGRLERAVSSLLLEALEPAGIEAMIAAAEIQAKACQAERQLAEQRVERARYEAELARRQYDAVDPDNRLVARELERRWEVALKNHDCLRAEIDGQIAALGRVLTDGDQARLREYARDLPSLWHAPTTRAEDRKRIIRCLIDNVVVSTADSGGHLVAKVHWKGGDVTAIEVRKPRVGEGRCVTDPDLLDLIRRLAGEFSDDQIARILLRKHLRTATRLSFTPRRVTNLRMAHGIPGTMRAALANGHVYTADQAASILGVSPPTVTRWLAAGLLHGSQAMPGAPWRVQVTEEDRHRLVAAEAPSGWLPLRAAARVLGVSQQTVLHRLKSAQLQGVRVRNGGRTAWRIHVPSTCYESEPSLFGS
jgi:DNA invertase Pin-like site-specific DNA recombinase